jgi:hypothetical protein
MRWDSSVGIEMSYWLDKRGSIHSKDFAFLQSVHTVSGAHLTSKPMNTAGIADGARNWPLTSVQFQGQEIWALHQLRDTPSWRGE